MGKEGGGQLADVVWSVGERAVGERERRADGWLVGFGERRNE